MMPELIWTRFSDRSALVAREQRQEWHQLLEHIQAAGPYASKAACPWIKLARFGTARSRHNSLRNNRNVTEITGLEGDYDGEQMQPEEAVTLLEHAGLRAAVYTSPSHTPTKPRWRVLAPLARPLPASERSQMMARINGALGGVLTPESFTLSQSYYYGRVAGQDDYRVLVTFDDPEDGHCVDLIAELDRIAVGPSRPVVDEDVTPGAPHALAAAVEQLGRRLRTGDNRRGLLRAYIGDKSVRGLSADEIGVLVKDLVGRFFDPEDTPDWPDITGLIEAFTSEDSARRQAVQDTVGEFVAGLTSKAAEEPQKHPARRLRRSAVDLSTLRPVKWVLQGFVASGEVVVWAGQPGVGKSTVFAALSLVVAGFGAAMGSDIMNDRPRRVVIVSEHAGQYERLLYGFIHRFGLSVEEVQYRIVLFDAARLAHAEIAAEVTALIADAAQDEEDPPLVILDTASASFDVADENSNAEIGGMLAEIKRPVAMTGAPLWVIAHAAKALGREDSEITPRGASAYIGDVHGTGSVFRDKNFPSSTFVKSLKNRSEREFNEVEVRTEVVWHEVTDERGVIQRVGIRLGVPMISGDVVRQEAAQASADADRQRRQQERSVEIDAEIVQAIGAAIARAELLSGQALAAEVAGSISKRPADIKERIRAMVADGRLARVDCPAKVRPNPQTHHIYLFPSTDAELLFSGVESAKNGGAK